MNARKLFRGLPRLCLLPGFLVVSSVAMAGRPPSGWTNWTWAGCGKASASRRPGNPLWAGH